MKRIVSFFFFIVFVSFLGCSPDIANINSKGENIICFGNSITAGSGAEKGEDFPSLLAEELDLSVINAGRGRDTTFDALKRIERDVLEKNPLLVIVEFGGNDFLRNIPPEETFSNLEKIVVQIQEEGAIVAIAEVHAPIFMNKYKGGFKEIAKKRKAVLIPNIFSGILDKPNLKSDTIHPNAQGYKIIAQRILNIIEPVLDKNRSLRDRH